MDEYKAAWKALKISLMQKSDWTSEEIFFLMSTCEAEYAIGMIGDLLSISKEIVESE